MREGIGLLVDIGHDSASRYLLDGLAVLMDELRLGSVAPKRVRSTRRSGGRPAAARGHLSPLPRGTARVDLAPALEQLERVVSRNRAAAARGLAAKGDHHPPSALGMAVNTLTPYWPGNLRSSEGPLANVLDAAKEAAALSGPLAKTIAR